MQSQGNLKIVGILLTILFGILTRFFLDKNSALFSVTYVFVLPAVLGLIPLIIANSFSSILTNIFISLLAIVGYMLCIYLSGLEELIGVVVIAGPFLIMSLIGSFVYKIVKGISLRKAYQLFISLIFPIASLALENSFTSSSQMINIECQIPIKSSPAIIWNNIVEVKRIRENEFESNILKNIGIPRPLFATVNRKAVGGYRIGNFEGGIKFIEKITRYIPQKYISFDIEVDDRSLGDSNLDQYIFNNTYFNFVNATYRLVPVSPGRVVLMLSTNCRISSNLNFYVEFWANIILRDFQQNLLTTIKKRCERTNP